MEQLSSLDAVFLAVEDHVNTMNIGTVAVFDGPVPPVAQVRSIVERRVASVPRCRQRIREPGGPLGRAVWIDDTRFDLDQHVHALSLHGGDPEGLESEVAALLMSPLDRRRPLWEVWVVDGLAGGRWALVAKAHHCMVDGIAGNDLLGAFLTELPDEEPSVPERWVPSPVPSPRAFAWFSIRSALGTLSSHVRGVAGVLGHPARSWEQARHTVAAAKRLWFRQPHVPTSLVGPIGTHRRWARTAVALDEVAQIRSALGGTVNDVVVAAVSIGFRELLAGRGEPIVDRCVTAMVPVSLRLPSERGETGNRVANVHARLPMEPSDPESMLRAVQVHLEELKQSHEVEATSLLLRVGDYVPRVVADRIARSVLHRQRNVETVITNVPGPRAPRYLGSHRMIEGYPVAPIAGRVRIAVAIWSYCGWLYLGITGDRDTAADVDRLARGIGRGFDGLAEAARSAAADIGDRPPPGRGARG